MFRSYTKVHFTGIGGIGMSGIAEILHHQGFQISGSDRALSEVTEHLRDLGMTIFEGHAAENVKDADVLVYSSAVSADNPELLAAKAKHIPVIKRAEMLAECMRIKHGIGIAGTHGKTTTTSLTGMVLTEGLLDPTIIVGGKLSGLGGTNARLGNGELIVVEADEFDRSFLKLSPTIAAITNIEKEHLDTYKDFEDIKATFTEYANKVPFYGFVVACIDDPGVVAILPDINRKVIGYGITEAADMRAVNIQHSNFSSTFTVTYFGKELGSITLNLPGLHMVKNALVAITIGVELNVPFATIKKALESFNGVYRRFEVKYDADVLVIDDYAHHPTEVLATLSGIKSGWNRRLIAVFQPHLYTRTRDFYHDFGKAFMLADVFICADVYPARELPIEGVTGELIVNAAKTMGHKNAHYVPNKSEIPVLLNEIYKKDDIIITMGAGDLWKYGEEFIASIKANQ